MNTSAALLLRQKGLRVTAQRLAIMQAVSAQPHATADDLTDSVRGMIGSISRQAVYDALGTLADHLIRRVCGTTADVDCAVGSTPCLTAYDDRGFTIDEAEVIYWGICPTCQPQTNSKQSPMIGTK